MNDSKLEIVIEIKEIILKFYSILFYSHFSTSSKQRTNQEHIHFQLRLSKDIVQINLTCSGSDFLELHLTRSSWVQYNLALKTFNTWHGENWAHLSQAPCPSRRLFFTFSCSRISLQTHSSSWKVVLHTSQMNRHRISSYTGYTLSRPSPNWFSLYVCTLREASEEINF